MTVAELLVKLSADPSGLEKGMSSATRTVNRFSDTISAMGKTLAVAVTAPLLLAGGAAVSAAADFDSLRRGLTAISGSAQEADRQLIRLKEVARLPGLGFREAIQGSVTLQAVGLSAQNAERYLTAFGNAVATTGGGKMELDRITTQLGQMANSVKVSSRDLRPMIDAAPAVGRAVREAFGTLDTEAIQKSGITTAAFLNRLVTQLETLPKVTGGAKNEFENLTDSLYRARVAVGTALLPAIQPLLSSVANLMESLSQASPQTLRFAISIGAIAVAAGPLLLLMGGLASASATLFAAFGSVAAFLAGPVGVALAASIALFALFRTNLFGTRTALDGVRSGLGVTVPPMQRFIDLIGDAARIAAVFASILLGRLLSSIIASTGAAIANAVAMGGMALSARIATGAVAALDGALAFFGGPIGLAITVALAAVSLAFVNTGQAALQSAQDARLAAEEFKAALLTMDEATVAAKFYNTVQTTARLFDQIQAAEKTLASQRQQGPATTTVRVDRAPEQVVNTELGNQIAHNENALANLRRMYAANLAQQSALSDDLARRQDLQRQMDSATSQIATNTNTGTDKLGSTLDRVNDQLREFLELSRFTGVTMADQLPAAFSEQLTLTQRLGDQVDRLADGLSKLGARAPQAAVNMLIQMRENLSASRMELMRMSLQWEKLWDRANGLSRRLPSLVANAPANERPTLSRSVDETLGIGSGRVLGDLGANASVVSRAFAVLQEGALQLSRTFTNALVGMAGRAGEFAGNVAESAKAAVKAGSSLAAAVPSALGVAGALEIVGGFLNAIQPVLAAVTLPLRMLGDILSMLIIPVMRILFPVFKVVAIVGSYLGETIAKVVAAILNAVGGFIKAIGKLINAITPFANPGNPLVRAGQAMQNTASQFRSAADEMAKKRKELEHLSFDDALKRAGNAADKLSESLTGAIEGFKILKYRFAAADGVARTPPSVPSVPNTPTPPVSNPGSGGGGTEPGGGGRGPLQPGATFVINVQGNEYGLRELVRDVKQLARSNPEMRASLAGWPDL